MLLFPLALFAITATEIAQKSYNVNHSFYIKNMMIKRKKRSMILVIGRMPNKKARVTAIERFFSTEFNKELIESKDLVIIRSGSLKGLGILMTAYTDASKSHEYLMWIPALRKVRRMAEPKDAGLGAGDIAFLEDADTGYEMMTYIPQKLIKVNEKVKKSFWSERTLQKIKR
jgi:hypothetical protein